MAHDVSPTARALLALEVIQNCPGITAHRLGERLGVTERAARRYVAILRGADLPIESVSGPHGGYRVGRGLRLPPLMFTAAQAMGLVMAVLEGHRDAADPTDLVGSALAKIVRVLPERVAGPVRAFREVSAPRPTQEIWASPELTTRLIEACNAARRVRLGYRRGKAADRVMEVDPWAVVLRHSRWYLLGWSHTRQARRVLRVDRIVTIEALLDRFTPPGELDALRTLEEHLSQGWTHPVDVLVDATIEQTSRWVPRSLGSLEPDDEGRTRLRATTDDPDWYARQLAAITAPFRVIGSPELQRATVALGQRLVQAGRAEVST
ncbi:helix-turn-helix transcriptional regulator [Micromonospora sp. DT47]|uniref:helix-turn-helix transcriptional regulator n=1 Tax=Micromonospora sp. DT47 TaxID=3393431 RepID=UPI003CEE73D9